MRGLLIGESPRWHENRLWFSHWGMQEIIGIGLDGKNQVRVNVPANIPFCFDWTRDGRLLVVDGRAGLLLQQESDGSLVTHADLRPVSTTPWNEIVVDGRGNVYVNNTGFNFPMEQFAPGKIGLVSTDGSVRQVADHVAFPNGMVVTHDNSTLILAESYGNQLTAFEIEADGSLSHRRVWAPLGEDAPDGICLDAENAVWYADVPHKHCVRVREGGEILQTVELDRGCFACMLGGADGKTLFMNAAEWQGAQQIGGQERTGQVLSMRSPAPHAGYP